jgi:hypothetical protein|tara:strand:+ start:4348 stop:4581 length:234 start_codon:yes stop_codon:yes gene_type:complete
MTKQELEQARGLIGAFIEECGADAIVVLYSRVKKRKTETYMIPYGNAHTCNALIDYAYENFSPPDLSYDEEVEDDDE